MSAQLNKMCRLVFNVSSRGIYTEAYLAIGHLKQFQDEQRKYKNPQAELQRISHVFKRSE